MGKSRIGAASALLALLAGCQTDQRATEAPPPTDTRPRILAAKNQLWKDPDSIKNASISGLRRHLGMMWHVCVRANAKNAFGGYTGEKDMVIAIYDNPYQPPAALMSEAPPNYCPEPFEPFPELNGDYRPPPAKPLPTAKPKA